MNIEVRLPDGSVASFPQGTPNETMQAEIERYLASVEAPSPQREAATQAPNAPVEAPASGGARPNQAPPEVEQFLAWPQSQSPAAAPERRIPMNAMEAAAQRRGPPQRNADVHIRDPEAAPRRKTPRELEAEATRDKVWGAVGYGADRVAGAMSAAGSGLYGAAVDAAGTGFSVLGATGLGAKLERQSDIAYNVARDQLRNGFSSGRGKTAADYDAEPAYFRRKLAEGQTEPKADGKPAPAEPDTGKRPEKTGPLRLPKGMSIQEAMESGRGPEAIDLSMGDGSSVRLGKVPPKAMKNGVQSGMDFLIERSDAIFLKMLQAGDITGAKQFRDFVQNERTQKGMRYMNQAVIAANYGDSDAFTTAIDNMAKSYDRDGEWSVDTKGTRLITTDNGQAVGAVLALRNKSTGEVFEQEYQGMQQVIAAISDYGAPTAAYDRQKERVAAAVAKRIANAESYQEAFDSAFKEMFDSDSFVDYEKNAISQEELASRIEMVKQRIRAVRPDLVPEQSASPPPAGAASGVGAVTGGSNNQVVPTFQ
jgi:hypothetical protein